MTTTKIVAKDTPPELQRQLAELWPSVYAVRDEHVYMTEFERFELLLSVLNMVDVAPCPEWCDESGTHSWTYELHRPAPGKVGRIDRSHQHEVVEGVTVEMIEFDPSCYALGEVDPGDDQPFVAVIEFDLHNLGEVEAHIAALREAARIAFGDPTRDVRAEVDAALAEVVERASHPTDVNRLIAAAIRLRNAHTALGEVTR
jgi:hypothetical protein